MSFAAAGASSLDYDIIGDFDGSTAAQFSNIPRVMQRACVDACEDQGWIIPFQQLVIHNAAE